MSKFSETATAVEPIIKMLDTGGCKYASAIIFSDGSGSIIVDVSDQDKARDLLRAHGVRLDGYRCIQDRDDYKFNINRDALSNYSETLCPHCGKDTLAAS